MARGKPPPGIVHVTLHLLPAEAAALAEMCRRFEFADAQHLLRHTRKLKPDRLCEAITGLLRALTAAGVE
jgi:hypothetical protein